MTVEPDSMKKKPEPKACLSYSINQILTEVEVRSWDTESQVALSEEDNEEEKEEEKEEDKEEEESKEKVQVRGFSNSITDVFDIHEMDGIIIVCSLLYLVQPLDLLIFIKKLEHRL